MGEQRERRSTGDDHSSESWHVLSSGLPLWTGHPLCHRELLGCVGYAALVAGCGCVFYTLMTGNKSGAFDMPGMSLYGELVVIHMWAVPNEGSNVIA